MERTGTGRQPCYTYSTCPSAQTSPRSIYRASPPARPPSPSTPTPASQMPIRIPSPPLCARAAAAAALVVVHHPPIPLHPFPTPIPSSSPMASPAAAPTYIDATNQNGVIAIVTGFSLCVVLLSVGVRLYARRYASVYRWDDVAFYVTAALGVGQIAVGLYMVGKGLGKTVEKLGEENFVLIKNVSLFWGGLFCLCIFFSPVFVVAWLGRRETGDGSEKRVVRRGGETGQEMEMSSRMED
jgi:hypothetical protein